MRITKCDICKKTINREVEIFQIAHAGEKFSFSSFEICGNCGKPIMKILKGKKLIKDNEKKNGGKK